MSGNMIGPEGIRDLLYQFGITNPHDLNDIMRYLDKYVTYCCSRRHPELEEPFLIEPAAPRKPAKYRGNPDIDLTCNRCGRTARAGDAFYRRPDTVTGWGLRCKTCVKKPGAPDGHPNFHHKKEGANGLQLVQEP